MRALKLLFSTLIAGLALATQHAVAADPYPSRPVKIVLPFAPGGASDALARLLAPKLGEELGQPVVIDNRPGAGGNVAALAVLAAPADGHTILMGSSMLTTNKHLYRGKLSYDPEKDFAAVVHLGGGPYVLVAHPSVPARNMEELIALSKSTQLFYASSGIGGASHLAGELLKLQSGVKMTHTPFRGGGPAVMAVLSSQPSLLFGTIASSATHIRSGGLRAIAVTSDKRAPQLPDVPTLAELGVKGYNVTTWDALVVPTATPRAVIDRLNAAVVKVIRMPEVSEKIREMGYTPTGSSAQELGDFLKAEAAVWARVIQDADIRVD